MKIFFDTSLALILLIILFPLYLSISLLILIFMGRPIFFIQPRAGKNCKIFNLYKFRTMKNLKNYDISDEKRITKLGNFLRMTSLDELPTLINIIKQEMCFVGPRPLLVEYLDFYNDYQIKRHLIKPGLTGWAQINGRNLISWEEKFNLDIWYIENRTFILDIKIILITIKKVLLIEGVSPKDSRIMKRFDSESKIKKFSEKQ